MFRYFAVIFNSRSDLETAFSKRVAGRLFSSSPAWQEVLNSDGMRVFCADATERSLDARPLAEKKGVVLGTLFRRNPDIYDSSPCEIADLDERESLSLWASRGKRLITHYWGNYVAILSSANPGQHFVVKDPTGSLPCMSMNLHGITLLFSCLPDCLALRLSTFSPSWRYIAQRLVWNGRSTIDCSGLNEITEIHRGECLEICATAAARLRRHRYWNPLSFRGTHEAILDADGAASALVSTLVSCTHSLSACHRSALIRLSGGLDSSIVLGCLKDAPSKTNITAFTYYSPRGRADPRPWARLAATDAGCSHFEHQLDPTNLQLSGMVNSQPSLEPGWVLGDLQSSAIEAAIAAQEGATAIFTGDGGDCGLGSLSIASAVRCYLEYCGLRLGLLRVALHVAMCNDLSIWRVLAQAVKGNPQNGISATRSCVTSRFVNSQQIERLLLNEWRAPQQHDDAPRDVLIQLGELVLSPKFYNSFSEPCSAVPLRVEPMYSQPVVELLLRIPIFIEIENGRDRGLARRAFKGRVPQALLNRVWKDRAPQVLPKILQRNRGFIREMLLDGLLVKEGLLNRDILEGALSGSPTSAQFGEGELMSHLDVEIWLQKWGNLADPIEPLSLCG